MISDLIRWFRTAGRAYSDAELGGGSQGTQPLLPSSDHAMGTNGAVTDSANRALAALFDHAPEPQCILDPDLRLLRANGAFAQLTGVPADRHGGLSLRSVLPELAALLNAEAERAMAGVPAADAELRMRPGAPGTADGGAWKVAVRRVSADESGSAVLGIRLYRDVAGELHRVRGEGAEARLRQILDALSWPAWVADRDGRSIAVNKALRQLIETAGGHGPFADWSVVLHPGDRPRVVETCRVNDLLDRPFALEVRCSPELNAAQPPMTLRFAPLDTDESGCRWLGLMIDCPAAGEGDGDIPAPAGTKLRLGRDQFIARLVHELRNPLAPILTSAQLLSRKGRERPELLESAAGSIERQVRQLTRMIDGLAELSRIGRGMIQLDPAELELEPLFRRVLERVKPLVEQRGQELRLDCAACPLTLVADAARIEQILGHLLNNASNFTPSGGAIQVRAERDGAQLLIAVRDCGAGIPRDQISHLFDLFAPVGKPVHGAPLGFGIGLAVSRGLVELHGGRLEIHSEGEGKGTEAVIRMPLTGG